MAKKSKISEIMGGDILITAGVWHQMGYVIFIFFLILVIINLNYTVNKKLITERHNQIELKNLKAEYVGKRAKLLYMSKRSEVEQRLNESGSKVKAPSDPPLYLIIE